MNFHKPKRYRIWDAKTITIIATIVMVLSTGLIFSFGHKTVFVETQMTLSVIALSLFLFLSVGLYHGVRIKKQKVTGPVFKEINFMDAGSGFEIPSLDFDFDIDAGEGLLGILISIVLWIIVSIILLIVLASIASVLWAVFLVMAFCVYWVFYRALRQVFVKSKICKNKVLPSVGYSLLYTILYTGWLFVITWGSKFMMR